MVQSLCVFYMFGRRYDTRMVSRKARRSASNCVVRICPVTEETTFRFLDKGDLGVLQRHGTDADCMGDVGIMWWDREKLSEEVKEGGTLDPTNVPAEHFGIVNPYME